MRLLLFLWRTLEVRELSFYSPFRLPHFEILAGDAVGGKCFGFVEKNTNVCGCRSATFRHL